MSRTLFSLALVAALLFGLVSFGTAADAEPVKKKERVEALVADLASVDFLTRQAAERELVAIGAPAAPQLRELLNDPETELRYRAARILELLDVRREQEELALREALLDQFVVDEAGDREYDFPGWKRFQEEIGQDREARTLFAAMLRKERPLMERIDDTEEGGLTRAVTQRNAELKSQLSLSYRRQADPVDPASIAALTFAVADPKAAVDYSIASNLGNLLQQAENAGQLAAASRGPLMKKLVRVWLSKYDDINIADQKMQIGMRLNIPETVETAVAVLEQMRRGQRMSTNAVVAVARFGKEQHRPLLAALLTNETRCNTHHTNNEIYYTEIRDVALAGLVHMTGQKYADYHFNRLRGNDELLFYTYTLGFSKDDASKREEALKKWDAWATKNAPELKIPPRE